MHGVCINPGVLAAPKPAHGHGHGCGWIVENVCWCERELRRKGGCCCFGWALYPWPCYLNQWALCISKLVGCPLICLADLAGDPRHLHLHAACSACTCQLWWWAVNLQHHANAAVMIMILAASCKRQWLVSKLKITRGVRRLAH